MFKFLGNLTKECLQDNTTGGYSHSRVIAMIVAIAATVFIWKLIILGGMSIEYFVAYLAYGTGHQTLNKFLDYRGAAASKAAETKTDDADPKPPKE